MVNDRSTVDQDFCWHVKIFSNVKKLNRRNFPCQDRLNSPMVLPKVDLAARGDKNRCIINQLKIVAIPLIDVENTRITNH